MGSPQWRPGRTVCEWGEFTTSRSKHYTVKALKGRPALMSDLGHAMVRSEFALRGMRRRPERSHGQDAKTKGRS